MATSTPLEAAGPLILGRQLPHGLVLMPATTDPAVARAWLTRHSAAGIEGVVTKRPDQPYRAGPDLAQDPRLS